MKTSSLPDWFENAGGGSGSAYSEGRQREWDVSQEMWVMCVGGWMFWLDGKVLVCSHGFAEQQQW